MSVRLAFFDLDKTILSVNSGTLWVRREAALGHLSKWQAVRALWWLGQYQLGLASAESMVAQAVSYIKGTSARDFRQRTKQFFHEEVRGTYRPGALETLRHYRKEQWRLIMLTSSTQYLADLVAEDLQFDEVLCNRLGAEGDVHTGRVVGRICFGEGKLEHAQGAAQRAGAVLREATFYTDSYSDLSVLSAVALPVAVNPDPRLRRHARKHHWPTVDWGTA